MIPTESPAQYQIHRMADRYEVRTREGRIRGEYVQPVTEEDRAVREGSRGHRRPARVPFQPRSVLR
ncbi:hypothetical protein [Streptomyces manipurensis]|uniref:hypothetical protein n=1 Tax=Streptomyces manipurensis TaxID=1077945 RepID=UPI003C6ED75A